MGNPIRAQAEELGLTNLPQTVLYGQPSSVRQTFSRCVPNIDRAIQDYISSVDPSFVKGRTGGVKAHTYSIFSPKERIYIEDTDFYVGWAHQAKNHVLKITIYTDSDEKRRKIAQVINNVFFNGMLANIDWKKIEKKFKVKREECIAMWELVLGQQLKNEKEKPRKIPQEPLQKPSQDEITRKTQEYKKCGTCGKNNKPSNKFCIECGNLLD